MIRRPPRSTRTDTLFPTRRSSDLPKPLPARPLRSGRVSLAADGCGATGAGRRMRSDGCGEIARRVRCGRSEEHTSELQSLMRISYAVFCLKKKKQNKNKPQTTNQKEIDTNQI